MGPEDSQVSRGFYGKRPSILSGFGAMKQTRRQNSQLSSTLVTLILRST